MRRIGNTNADCQLTHVAWRAACGTQRRDEISIHSLELLQLREGALVMVSSFHVGERVGSGRTRKKSNSICHLSLVSALLSCSPGQLLACLLIKVFSIITDVNSPTNVCSLESRTRKVELIEYHVRSPRFGYHRSQYYTYGYWSGLSGNPL